MFRGIFIEPIREHLELVIIATMGDNSSIVAGSKSEVQPDGVPRGSALVELNFFEPPSDGSPPFQYAEEPPAGMPAANYRQVPTKIQLSDIRGYEGSYTLNKDAFLAVQHFASTTPYESFSSEEKIKEEFYPEVERLLLEQVEGSHKIIIFDHVVRRERKDSDKQPLHTAHADQTARAAEARVRLYVTDPNEAEELLKGRFRIINVWKPLVGPVISCPLAFASGASVQVKDLVPIEFRLPTRKGEIVGVRHNPDQKWMYWSGMNKEEAILLKCNDSEGSVARQVPHSAFNDPRSPVGAQGRESIEVRALVFG